MTPDEVKAEANEVASALAKRNVELKTQYHAIDDPVKAINFMLDEVGDIDGFDFLDRWREGDWADIEKNFPEFLDYISLAGS